MLTFLLLAIVVVAVSVLLARGRGLAGSAQVVDRDAQRLQAELNAIRFSHHR
ncbi:hypothetical protein [Nocardia bhagyanarayanae]|uniref:hypothetical protein n=1 Tax=Nocardia bhagyanarayanae TaxID=1215925 RepID=UPI0016398142|nr:hypothetical protein [Nocardia bhagyanarayanae]